MSCTTTEKENNERMLLIYAETRPRYTANRVKKHDIMYAPATI
jgi:hypothetical protein